VPRHIVVGYDDSDGARDAAVLGERLAHAAGRELALVRVVSGEDEVTTGIVVRAASVAQGLQAFAEEDDAAAIVVGSPTRAPSGGLAVGTVAQSLLHGSPCAVALAPSGYSASAPGFGRIVVGYTDSDEARAALRVAAGLGEAYGATVRVVSVTTGSDTRGDELDRSLRRLAAIVRTESRVVDGDPARRLLEQADGWADLIVVGSRGYGPARQVLVGSVSAALLATARVPVVVTPRAAENELVGLEGATASLWSDEEAASL